MILDTRFLDDKGKMNFDSGTARLRQTLEEIREPRLERPRILEGMK